MPGAGEEEENEELERGVINNEYSFFEGDENVLKLNYYLNSIPVKMSTRFFWLLLKSHVGNKDVHYRIIIVAIALKQSECMSRRNGLNYGRFPKDTIMVSFYLNT